MDNAGNVGGFVAGALATLGFLLLERRVGCGVPGAWCGLGQGWVVSCCWVGG